MTPGGVAQHPPLTLVAGGQAGRAPDGHGHSTLPIRLLSLVASEGSLLREVHAAEEVMEARRARPHREAVGQRTSRSFVIAC